MNTAKLVAVLFALFCVGPAQASDASATRRMEGAVVDEVRRAPFESGVIAWWHRVTVVTREGEKRDLFSLSMSADEVLPEPGQVCAFDYRMGQLRGSAGDRLPRRGDWAQIDRFTCAPAGPGEVVRASVRTLEHATVHAVYRAEVGSGALAVWHRVVAVSREGEVVDLFSLSLSTQEPLPRPGDVCTFEYHRGEVETTGGPPYASSDGRIIDRFTCAPAT